ncbi:MAG: hypothetical protein C0602_00060 [Denitrovibrio sp.]|nr:MAG: hypothetical protein C0602_00060 [Denitrovibrio sp.]
MLTDHKGKFLVQNKVRYDEQAVIELREAFKELEFVPMVIEHKWDQNMVLYYGYSPHFKEIDKGTEIPEYKLQVTKSTIAQMVRCENCRECTFGITDEAVFGNTHYCNKHGEVEPDHQCEDFHPKAGIGETEYKFVEM